MVKNLIIVESPAKAKTIEGYLGPDFVVRSSYGHVRDLPKDNNAIDIANGFKPTYVVSADKKELIGQLKKLAKEAELVWLASDDDREGEAISWHLAETLNLAPTKTRRIVFREITKNAILGAIANPREVDQNLVNAQQARRVLDRLVGFELSPVLWKKVKPGLSAGRVQSVAVRLVVEREREVSHFLSASAYRVVARFDAGRGAVLEADLPTRFKTRAEAEAFLNSCVGATYRIESLDKKPGKRSPAAPFTTSTLQQEASRKLGYSVAQTMSVAQKLYEAGKISYMRTDSVNLSQDAQAGAQAAITAAYGAAYHHQRTFKTKSASAQEAHEAIRPTDFGAVKAGGDASEQRLYDLIRKRAMASQMAEAVIERTTAVIGISTLPGTTFGATGEVITFEGFLKVYAESKDDEDEDEDGAAKDSESSFSRGLPPLSVGQALPLQRLSATERFSAPPARYTEASLVKKLEELGIGRPSTYAPTISTVQKRGYVEKDTREGKERKFHVLTLADAEVQTEVKTENYGAEKAKLFPTDTAMVVNDFLVAHFPTVVDFQFTAKVEDEFDQIANGHEDWTKMLTGFYGKFHATIEAGQDIERSTLGGTRELGVHPDTGDKITARLGKYGPYVALGDPDGEVKPAYANLRKGQFIESLTLEEALELFKLPRIVGQFEDKDMTAALGRFGPYVRHDGKFFSLTKEQDPHTITGDEAVLLIENKRKTDAERLIKAFPENPDIQVLNGRFGPYIVAGKKNVKIPKGEEPADLTLARCQELADATPDKPAKGGRFAKKAAPAEKGADEPAKKKPAAAKKPAAKKATAAAKKPAAKAAAPKKAAPRKAAAAK
ncbi:type I DNA topoisomerase [Hymenobacter caeli]|uniref:DNA topoisomerase 1 n=1 Tax=Hymenobacter caeli TaxID=2735894 RepID=A0ABX2FKS5_9BACT|nr:type I DNA topoisomerase [Hymenobacter caeli]NRT17738.1 DNA topoisomerase-1 [Hymenobacter caeli]